jgi:hypothetical protein
MQNRRLTQKIPKWVEEGRQFGEEARQIGMIYSDDDTSIKAVMVVNSITPGLRVGQDTTTYAFTNERFLHIVVHHYHQKIPSDNKLLMVMFPLDRLVGICEVGMMNIIRKSVMFLGNNPDTPGFELVDEDKRSNT